MRLFRFSAFLILALMLISVPYMNSSNNHQRFQVSQDNFILAADGDTSSDSILYFNETTPDDVLYFPDNDSTGTNEFADSFEDTSNKVAEYLTEAPDVESSDGDVLTLHCDQSGAAYDYDYWCFNIPDLDISGGEYWLESRHRSSIAASGMRIMLSDNEASLGSYDTVYVNDQTYFVTQKWLISSAWESAPNTIKSIWLSCELALADGDKDLIWDYIRIYKNTECGFQHDCSELNMVNVTDAGMSYSSDGDMINVTTGASAGSLNFYYDDSTSAGVASLTYYPFIEWSIYSADAAAWAMFATDSDGDSEWIHPSRQSVWSMPDYQTSPNTGVFRANIAASSTLGDIESISLYVKTNSEVIIDYVKIYAIADFSVTSSGVEVNDTLYTNAGWVYSTADSGEYLQMNYDQTISVAVATYNICNLSVDTRDNLWWKHTAGGWQDAVINDSRFELTGSGSLTDFAVQVPTNGGLGSIMFWADGTDPVIQNTWVNPPQPDDDESVSFTTYVTDTVGCDFVTLNAITYPSGFSDVDYFSTEQSVSGAWVYTFDSMPNGYYLFAVTADDGQGSDVDYITISARESEIIITPITFFGVGSDFTQMQMSFEINKDCSYTIYEESDTYSFTDTHTGSVSSGWSNIAWTKISVTDALANFSILFTNGSLSTWINGSYSIAQTTFYCEWIKTASTSEQVTLTGYITKAANYTVYDSDGSVHASGTVSQGTFIVSFDIWNKYTDAITYFKVTFANGSQSFDFEDYYQAIHKASDYEGKAGIGDTPDAQNDRNQIQFWVFVTAIASLAVVCSILYDKIRGKT